MQGNVCFSASFNVLSLAGSNNLLTHTHTQERDQSNHIISRFFVRARDKRVTPINKGLTGVPFVRFSVPFCQTTQKRFNSKHSY